jgi:GPH family glycoside/pentoside/hexuronide:cation symporter
VKNMAGTDNLTVPSEKPLSFGHIFLYNLAGFSFNLYDAILYAWCAYFYTPPEGSGLTQFIPLASLGIILAGGRILDAVTDPLIGYLSDHTRSRWGRRKPFIFVSSPILFVSFILVWRPPVDGVSLTNAFYLAIVLFFYYCSYTGLLIPWFAVLPEMSEKNEVRTKIAAVGVAIGAVGALVGGGLSGPLISAWNPFSMALVLGVVALVASELTLFGVREKPRAALSDQPPPGFLKVVKEVFTDKQVLSFSGMIILVQMTYQLMLMNVPYFTTLILGRKEQDASILMAEVILLMAGSVPFWYWVLKKYPKRTVFRAIIVAMTCGFTLSYFIGRLPFGSPFVQALLVFPLAAIPVGGMFTAVLTVISDLTDYDELKSGQRREAIYFGIYGIVRKSGWALCPLILAGVFSQFGYSMENPQGVRVIWLVCALSCALGFVVFIPYKLGDSKEETKRIMGL